VVIEACATISCRETQGLEPVPGVSGKLCASCRVELALLVEQIRTEAEDRDTEIAKRRIE
jgi:hypothetical protein